LNNPIRRILGAYIRQRNQKILETATSQGIRGNFSWIIRQRNQKNIGNHHQPGKNFVVWPVHF
jgi:hypothetical protein